MALSCVYFSRECIGCMRCYDDPHADDEFIANSLNNDRDFMNDYKDLISEKNIKSMF